MKKKTTATYACALVAAALSTCILHVTTSHGGEAGRAGGKSTAGYACPARKFAIWIYNEPQTQKIAPRSICAQFDGAATPVPPDAAEYSKTKQLVRKTLADIAVRFPCANPARDWLYIARPNKPGEIAFSSLAAGTESGPRTGETFMCFCVRPEVSDAKNQQTLLHEFGHLLTTRRVLGAWREFRRKEGITNQWLRHVLNIHEGTPAERGTFDEEALATMFARIAGARYEIDALPRKLSRFVIVDMLVISPDSFDEVEAETRRRKAKSAAKRSLSVVREARGNGCAPILQR